MRHVLSTLSRKGNERKQQQHFAITITKLTNCCWASRTAGVNRIRQKQKTTTWKQNMKSTNRAGLQHVLSLSPSCSVLPLHLHSCSCPHMTLNLTLAIESQGKCLIEFFCCWWCIHLQRGLSKANWFVLIGKRLHAISLAPSVVSHCSSFSPCDACVYQFSQL